jgi:hypothetical protein
VLQTIEVEIDSNGAVRPLEPTVHLPAGRALLTLLTPVPDDATLLAESGLAADWDRPEEDAAWAHLQPER